MELSPAVLVGVVIGAAFAYKRRGSAARNEVWRLVYAGGLPKDEKQMAMVEGRLAQRQAAIVAGTVASAVACGVVLLALGADRLVPAIAWTVMAPTAGIGIGICVVHLRAVRAARPAGPRTATLRPRRLEDYLSRIEIVGQYVMLVFPLLALGLGVLVLRTADEHAGQGWVLVIAALSAIPCAVLGVQLQRRILQLNQPASSDVELQWQEALRAKALRDMGDIVAGGGWVFGSLLMLSITWPAGVPAYAEPLGWAIFVGGTAIQSVRWMVSQSKRGLGRSQAALRPTVGGKAR